MAIKLLKNTALRLKMSLLRWKNWLTNIDIENEVFTKESDELSDFFCIYIKILLPRRKNWLTSTDKENEILYKGVG